MKKASTFVIAVFSTHCLNRNHDHHHHYLHNRNRHHQHHHFKAVSNTVSGRGHFAVTLPICPLSSYVEASYGSKSDWREDMPLLSTGWGLQIWQLMQVWARHWDSTYPLQIRRCIWVQGQLEILLQTIEAATSQRARIVWVLKP